MQRSLSENKVKQGNISFSNGSLADYLKWSKRQNMYMWLHERTKAMENHGYREGKAWEEFCTFILRTVCCPSIFVVLMGIVVTFCAAEFKISFALGEGVTNLPGIYYTQGKFSFIIHSTSEQWNKVIPMSADPIAHGYWTYKYFQLHTTRWKCRNTSTWMNRDREFSLLSVDGCFCPI